MTQRIILGRIGAPQGIHGWLRITSHTSPPTNILNYTTWQIKRGQAWSSLSPEETKTQGNKLLVKLPDCDSPEVAKQWTNTLIAIYQNELPKLPEDEFYWSDLINCQVVTSEGVLLGNVTQLLETGANDVLIIQGNEQRHLVPYTDDTIQHIDLSNQLITVQWDPNF
ncbi:MAG: ribosome maturation factor RimM [Coxiellaceae bacterium]|nr:ribosome maturation factor RimM [Coxiellaceae bacterium]|tara:strand:- start:4229 stop:4729 length:501 start_codon:yes stop_codon:yes gene_type:complete